MKVKKKTIKAWAFMADSEKGKYLITDLVGETEIYLKKPAKRQNPFDYSGKGKLVWKPTELTITYSIT